MMISSDAEMKEELKSDISDGDSDSESYYDGGDIGLSDEVNARLMAAGPVGLAAAAAIATGRRRKRGYVFETNPSIRRRQQTRLLRRLRATIDEYCVRVGQQAIVVCCAPGSSKESFRVFGAKPLEDVMKNIRNLVIQDLEIALARQAPNSTNEDSDLFELPPLVIDGIPTPIDKMAQQQLRMFIPHMLKYATGRGKPGWGREELKPIWWPDDVPWKNIRIDERSEAVKQTVSWTHALRQIVKNCYAHYGREDLLPSFDETLENKPRADEPRVVQTLTNPDGSISFIPIDAADSPAVLNDEDLEPVADASSGGSTALNSNAQIFNVSSIQHIGDTNTAVVTLQDGSVHHIATEGRTIQPDSAGPGVERFLSGDMDQGYGIEATIDADGQLVVTGDVSALTSGELGDNVYNMVLPGSRSQLVTIVDGEMVELEQLSKKRPFGSLASSRNRDPGFTIESTPGNSKDGSVLQIENVARPSKRSKINLQDPGKSFVTRSDTPGEIVIENPDRTFSVISSDKIQLIPNDDEADPNSLHEGGYRVIEIAPGVQQLGVLNNNILNNHNNNDDVETVIDARHALVNIRSGDDPGGGGGGGSRLDSLGIVDSEGVEVTTIRLFGDERT